MRPASWNSSALGKIHHGAQTASSIAETCGRRSPTPSRSGPKRAPFAACFGRY
jgi:hypothetical protein